MFHVKEVISVWLYASIITVAYGLSPDIMNHPNWNLLPRDTCGQSVPLDRIIGGKEASLGQYPWIARIGYSARCKPIPVFQCAGALINDKYVVTASHCVRNLPMVQCDDKESPMIVAVVRLGENYANSKVDCDGDICAEPLQDIVPKMIVSHKRYGRPIYKHDIALIRLSVRANLNGWVLPICMPRNRQLITDYEGSRAEVAGFGIFDMKRKLGSDILLTLSVPIINNEQCAATYNNIADIGNTQICAGGKVGEDSCNGDSGGPLMNIESVDGKPPAYYILGVVSFGATICGSTPQPGIYTKISSYIEWILDSIQP